MTRDTHKTEEIYFAGLGALSEGRERFRRLESKGRRVETRQERALMNQLIEAMIPDAVPTPAMVLQARRNSAARMQLAEEFGLLTSAEIADLNQSAAENRAALANGWKQAGKIFSVRLHGRDYFPGFQFDPDGRPREVIARLLAILGAGSGWDTALWFLGDNGYLDGDRPVDRLEGDAEPLLEAARREVEEIHF